MKLLLSLLLLPPLVFGEAGTFESLTFAWDRAPSHGTNITFRLKYGTDTNQSAEFIDAGTNTTATVTNLTSGVLHFTVVATTEFGLESLPSNWVVVTNYPAAPLQLKLSSYKFPTVKLEGTLNGGMEWRTLALVTNDPVTLKGAVASMLFRATTNLPPAP